MRQLVVVMLVVVASVGPAAAVGGTDRTGAPFAEAGLDQSVGRGTTVLLDGSGSRDPNGRIVRYEWRIETPSGAGGTPRDEAAPRTTFVASDSGRYVVTLTVTDDGGNTASDSLYVDVRASEPPIPTRTPVPSTTTAPPAPPTPPATAAPSTTPPSRTATPTPRANRSPTIRGPQLVTGERPLEGEYSIATAGVVENAVWWVDGGDRTVTSTLTRAWSPGDHSIRAEITYTNGVTETATFEDGTTRVVADPKPELTLSNIETQERLGGSALATDGYGNLESVDVTVDGLGTERAAIDSRTRSEVGFDWTAIEPGRAYDLVATAVDERGQRTTIEKRVTPVGPPEIVSVGFVNGPVDSYHPRIDPARYTAHHVLEIDLNGHPVDGLDTRHWAQKPSEVRQISDKITTVENEIATVHTYWAGETPSIDREYGIGYSWWLSSTPASQEKANGTSGFTISPSKPELRIEMRNDGGRPVGGPGASLEGTIDFSEPIIIDASDSFDPDGSKLRFVWDKGANPITASNDTAQLSGWEDGRLILKDGFGNKVYQNWSAQQSYVPDIVWTEVMENGPFPPDERITVQFRTQIVHFRRNTASIDIDAELRGSRGTVIEWNELQTDDDNTFAYNGTVELPASALAENGPDARIVLYNTARPDYASKTTRLPTVELTDTERTRRADFEVTDLRYVIRTRTVDETVADSRAEMRQLRNGGYEVASTDTETTGYRIEKRVQTQEEIVRSSSRSFGSSYNRRLFLKTHPEWQSDGTRTERHRVANHHTEWKRTRQSGFTGDTRRVLSDPAEYVVEREYEYTSKESRTREVTSRQCLPYGGCYEVTYDKTVRVDVTHSYWAQSKMLSYHTATGAVRRTLVAPAEYATEYRHEYTTWTTETEYEYAASHTTIVQPARYEWQHYDTVTGEEVAWRMVEGDSNLRVAEAVTERRWTMERQRTEEVIRPAYTADDEVVETRATVSGNVVRYRTSESGFKTARVVEEFATEYTGRGIVEADDIKERVRESEEGQ